MRQLVAIMLLCGLVLGLVACGQVPESSRSTLASTTASIFKPSTPSSSSKQTIPTSVPAESTTAPTTAPTKPSKPTYPKAPDFTVYDSNGEAVKLSDFAGKPVVLNFWASWCGPCKAEMPDFQEAYEKYGEQVQFMMVNLTDGSRETQDSVAAFIQQKGYTFPYFCDTTYSAASAYGIQSIPQTFFINADGYIVAMASARIDAERLQMGLEWILP